MRFFSFFKSNKDKKIKTIKNEDSVEEQLILIREIETVSKRIVGYEARKKVDGFIEILKSIIRITETKPQILNVRTFFSTICKDMYVYIKDYIRLQDSYKTDEVELQMAKLVHVIEQITEMSKTVYEKQLHAQEFKVDIVLRQLEKLKKYGI